MILGIEYNQLLVFIKDIMNNSIIISTFPKILLTLKNKLASKGHGNSKIINILSKPSFIINAKYLIYFISSQQNLTQNLHS